VSLRPVASDADRLAAEVLRASLRLRRAETAPVPGESIAEIEGNTSTAQRRTAAALMAWRTAVDAYLAEVP
jgi:hypothetical protein